MNTEKTPEEILNEKAFSVSNFTDLVNIYKEDIISAMKEYASQFQPKAISEEEIWKKSREYAGQYSEPENETLIHAIACKYRAGFKEGLSFSLPHKENNK
jgi:hypothetical protein